MIALSEHLKDEGDLPIYLPVGDWYAFHEGLQQREGLRTNEELVMIAESMDLLWGQTSTLKTHGLRVEEGGGNGSERVTGAIDHGDRRVVREGAQTNAELGRCEGTSKRPLVRGWSVDGTPVTRRWRVSAEGWRSRRSQIGGSGPVCAMCC